MTKCILRKFIIFAFIIPLLFSCKKDKDVVSSPPAPTSPVVVKERVSLTFTQLSRLRADGQKVVNAQNEEAVLRGVGLGNWLLQEGYMLGDASKAKNQWSMKKLYYNEGVSEQEVEAFYQKWRDNFITKADIDYIASLGFNAVRLPMHYELFLTNAQRAVRNSVIRDKGNLQTYTQSLADWHDAGQLFNSYDVEGYKVIDHLLEWCAANKMYVVLDLHAAPGGQGTDLSIADTFEPNYFWLGRDNKDRPVYQDITVTLWDRISERYKNDDRIAWYDLINEPNNVPSNTWIRDIHERLINVIRDNDDNHLLMVEGNGWGNNYNGMLPDNFTKKSNLIYSLHRYSIPEKDDLILDPNPNQINRVVNMLNFKKMNNVPVWVGETGENDNVWLKQNIAQLEKYNVGWCHWTYKRHDVNSNAAIMRLPGRYVTDGKIAMKEVLENILYSKGIPNTGTINAVAPKLN